MLNSSACAFVNLYRRYFLMPKDDRAEFIKIFNSLSRKHHKYDVFRDFF